MTVTLTRGAARAGRARRVLGSLLAVAILVAGCASGPTVRERAEAGDAQAQDRIGHDFEARKQYAEAASWYGKAVQQDDARAANDLGELYGAGLGVPKDPQKAFDLYAKAADLGQPDAMVSLGVMYGNGEIGPRPDVMNACIWLSRARRYAKPTDQKVLNATALARPALAQQMTPGQLASCTERADAWQPGLVAPPR
jgi:TPR repeat protein